MSEVEKLIENFSLKRLVDFRILLRDKIDRISKKSPQNVEQLKRLRWQKSIVHLAVSIKATL